MNRVLIPETIYHNTDKHTHQDSRRDTEGSSGARLPHPDVLVETYQAGESMIKYINGVTAAADSESTTAEATRKVALNKEIAALGLDAILKMV